MSRFKLGQLTQESLLASEELSQKTAQAEASTPQAYQAFIEASEKQGLVDREEQAKAAEEDDLGGDLDGDGDGLDDIGDGDGEGEGLDEDLDNPNPEDDDGTELDAADAVDDTSTEPEEVTEEALDEWIREKTGDSESKVVRNLGEAAAGLTKLGITYGPGLLQSMWSGAIWTFSRMGTMIFASAEYIGELVEKSVNSTNKLEARLKQAEAVIANGINKGTQLPRFQYKNSKVIGYLKTGKSLDIAGNLRQYSTALTQSNAALVNEFATGADSVNRLAQSAAKDKVTTLAPFMEVSIPTRGFKPGAPAGYETKNEYVEAYHTDPMWPGDASLVFIKPKKFDDIKEISKAYKSADMFVATGDRVQKATEQVASFAPTDLIMIAKSTKMLLSSIKEVNKSQSKLGKYDEALSNAVKRVFYSLADSQAKSDNKEAVTEMVYLRAMLVSKVYMKGSAALTTHASRVAAAAVQLLEAHAKRMMTNS